MSTSGIESEVSNLNLNEKKVDPKPTESATAPVKEPKAPKPKKDAPILLKTAKVFTYLFQKLFLRS